MKTVDINGTIQTLTDEEYNEMFPPVEQSQHTYEELVEQYIRERYTLNQELAINRQRETKPEEFSQYFAYCEQCKVKAKGVLNV